MADGPNNEQNFQKGILNARNNLKLIVKYLRNNSVETNYKDYLEVYVPKLEGTEYYDEFKADLDKFNKPKIEDDREPTEEESKQLEEEAIANGALTSDKLSEDEFRSLSAAEQKKLVKDLVKEEGDDSNADKRTALYLS